MLLFAGEMGVVKSDLINWDEGDKHGEASDDVTNPEWDDAKWENIDIKSGKSD